MPNHVRNELYFECDNEQRIVELLNTICGENGKMDFNKIIPMPKELDIESGSRGENGLEAYLQYMKTGVKPTTIENKWGYTHEVDDEDFELGKKYYENTIKYGHTTWYGWCCENWNTKWNAYESETLNKGVAFLTAWSAPFPVLLKLSEMFSDVTITHYFADENIGYNCGKFVYMKGIGEDITEFDDGSDEATRFACDVWGYGYDEHIEIG